MSPTIPIPLPAALPEKPTGYTKRMVMHLNYGEDGGAATYTIHDPDGREMPFNYAYRSGSKKKAENYAGFILEGHQDKALSWAELRDAWPAYVASKAEATT